VKTAPGIDRLASSGALVSGMELRFLRGLASRG
jgi:hypothetical protein